MDCRLTRIQIVESLEEVSRKKEMIMEEFRSDVKIDCRFDFFTSSDWTEDTRKAGLEVPTLRQ